MKGGLGNFLWEAGRGGSGTVDGLDCSSTSVTNCSTLEQVENDHKTSKMLLHSYLSHIFCGLAAVFRSVK